jgi:LPXTG-site transpeptidase (sortase) family protein
MPAGRAMGELGLLAGVIAATLAMTWSDGPYTSDVVDPAPAPGAAFLLPVGGYADAAHVRAPAPPPPAPPPEPVVPSARPATILIASLNVHRPVEAVGVDKSGHMLAPQNAWDGGWYDGGPVPGAPGDAVIEGHAGYPNAPLLFGKLRQLRQGDKIVVVLADGSRQIFLMTSESIWRAGTAPPDLGQPYGDPRLTLITCTGPFDAQYKTYADRLVVQASYVGTA